jgi:hypothetical protein
VIHAFQTNRKASRRDLIKDRLKATEGNAEMKREEKLEVVRGSGNVFRDLGSKNADVEHNRSRITEPV